MQHKFSIGQMAKLHNIPVKTLRYYDEIGLFTAFEVDEKTGYRYYHLEQFKKLDMIWYLKKMGVPLKEIKKRVEHSTINDFIHVLQEYESKNNEKMKELQEINQHLRKKVEELEKAKEVEKIGKASIQSFPERRIIEVTGQFRTLNDIEHVLRDLKRTVNHVSPVMIGKVGLMLSVEHVQDRQLMEYDGVFILVEKNLNWEHASLKVLPEGPYATIYTREGRKKESEYYDALLSYIEKNGYEPDGPFLVRQIVDSFISHREEERLREIQLKIKPLTLQ
ncbi:MerR family transcriptional regulator [Priestia megaterium]|uniref:MerR family transcriptional regulator n=1 Tax=Priestia megaterium TaxID=1404 RepID=UPI0023639106|nr:MerR family transcriptional regulator [Priestia megaterium]MDD1515250.1 MerR family transcriptional regulator [Priestia megaterium]